MESTRDRRPLKLIYYEACLSQDDATKREKYQPDFICYGEVITEIKAISGLTGNEEAQLINYLKATGFEVGLLIHPVK